MLFERHPMQDRGIHVDWPISVPGAVCADLPIADLLIDSAVLESD
jgi:hypothetical protein